MTTTVKWFSSEMAGAPQVSGTKGSLLSMIDACLVDGFGLQAVNSITVTAGIATVVLTANNFFQHQIVLVSGATPAGLNGEKRVIALTGVSSFTFDATGIADGAATGTITVKTAPLGWLKAFAGTNSGAYKIDPALHPDSTAHHVRISDTGNYSAQITGYESMTGVDTGSAPFPSAAQQTLWVFRSNSTDATARSWFVVGDSRFVYVGIHVVNSATGGPSWFGFGEFKSQKSADPYRFLLSGNYWLDIASSNDTSAHGLCGTVNIDYAWLVRSYTGLGGAVGMTTRTWPNSYDASGANAELSYPNGPDYGLYLCKANIFEKSPVCYRGDWPGMYFIPQNVTQRICPDAKTPYLDTEVPGFENKVVGFFPCCYLSAGWGVVAFDLTGPWEH